MDEMIRTKIKQKPTKEELLETNLAACKRFIDACAKEHAERRNIPNGVSWQDGDALLSVTITPNAELEFAYARALDMNECQFDMDTYRMIATGIKTKAGMKINIFALTEDDCMTHKHYFCCNRCVPAQYAKRSMCKFSNDANLQYERLLTNNSAD